MGNGLVAIPFLCLGHPSATSSSFHREMNTLLATGTVGNKKAEVPNLGLEPTVSRVTLLARERKRRATRPAAQPGRWADREELSMDF